MREVVNLQIGRCGNNIGTQFWELLCSEHGLDNLGTFRGLNSDIQLWKISSYFREVRGLRYIPRSIMIDLDKKTMDGIKSSPCASIFKQDRLVYGLDGTGNNWAKGHLTEGLELLETILDVTRKEAEFADCLQGFQIIHAIGGGTGSGLAALIMDNIADEYPGRNVATFTILPNPNDPKSSTEIYNAVLALSHLLLNSGETFLFDNMALHHIFSDTPKLANYTMKDLNHVISSAQSGITTCMRFNGYGNTDFRKIAVNYIPYPRLHFFIPSLAPLTTRGDITKSPPEMKEIISNLFIPRKMFVECEGKSGKFLTVVMFLRGSMCTKDVLAKLEDIQNINSPKFIEWLPDNVKTFIYDIPSNIVATSGTMISNTTAIQQILKRFKDNFNSMLRRKYFLDPYKSEGMDEMEFEEASASINDLIEEYKQSQASESNSRAESF